MATSQKAPNAEAIEDDERQYSHNPLIRQELETK
jgi:hypothetical protein